MRVLLIDDDPLMAKSIEHTLAKEGMICDKAHLGKEGLEIGKVYDYDIILLDLVLPDIEGFEVLLRLRSSKIKIPVLIISGLTTPEQKIKGLGFGADDYLTKPFNRGELIARIQAIVRRSKGHSESIIKFDKVTINIDTRIVEVNNKPIHVTGKEYAMLELLAIRKGSVLSKDMFMSHLYGGLEEPEEKIIDVLMCKLRRKLKIASGGVDYIETIWGRGHILKNFDDDNKVVNNNLSHEHSAPAA